MKHTPFDFTGYLYPNAVAALYTHIAAYNQDAEKFLTASPEGSIGFTVEGRNRVISRFRELVVQYPIDLNASDRPYDGIAASLGENAKGLYCRQAGIHRLPNALLFGSDTIGPDLTPAFAKLIGNASVRDMFLYKAGNAGSYSGRSGWLDEETRAAVQLFGAQDFAAHMSRPDVMSGIDLFFAMMNSGFCLHGSKGMNTGMYEFYTPGHVQNVMGCVFGFPSTEGLEKIALGIPENFHLGK